MKFERNEKGLIITEPNSWEELCAMGILFYDRWYGFTLIKYIELNMDEVRNSLELIRSKLHKAKFSDCKLGLI